MVLNGPIKVRPPADFFPLIDAVARIGVNFNRLIRRAYTLGTVSDPDMGEAEWVYQQVLRLMCEWEKPWRYAHYPTYPSRPRTEASPERMNVCCPLG